MNRLITKFLNTDLQNKDILYKYITSSPNPSKFCSLLTKINYYDFDNGLENCIFKNNFSKFVELNKNNIIFTLGGNEQFTGIYIHESGNFACLFTSFSKVYYEEDYKFTVVKGHEKELSRFIKANFCAFEKPKDLHISLLQENRGDYFLKKYPVLLIPNLNIEDNYNDDFIDVDKKLFNVILNNRKSLTILHGLPGTGKTTYIKNLCNRLSDQDREIVYLPPTITQMLASPSFINNLDLFKNKVVIIEDAESVLVETNNRSQAIANILNITDGILADIYNIHFIFTFNMDIRKIDQALLRKGRLTMKYEFKELSKEKVAKLAKKLGVETPKVGTLAEMYNSEDNGNEDKNKVKLGF